MLGNVIIKVLANETRDLFLYKSSTRQVILLWLKGKEHLWQHFDCLNQCYDSNGPIIIYLLFEISVLCLKNALLILVVIFNLLHYFDLELKIFCQKKIYMTKLLYKHTTTQQIKWLNTIVVKFCYSEDKKIILIFMQHKYSN